MPRNLTAYFFILILAALAAKPAWGETIEIRFTEKDFEPAYLYIQLGDTLRFINTDNLLHTVTSGRAPEASGTFDSGYLTKKMEFEYTPTEPGMIDFFCVMHSDVMRGAVIVEPGPSRDIPAQ